jgi:hypothetical protein
MQPLPLDTAVEAEYSDGFILSETQLNDINPYGEGNTLRAIIDKAPEAEHGRLVRFSVFYHDNRYDVDWTNLPDNARPIRFRHGFITLAPDGATSQGWSGMQIGYQYNDDDGENHQQVQEL